MAALDRADPTAAPLLRFTVAVVSVATMVELGFRSPD